jgi:hypothetical protein
MVITDRLMKRVLLEDMPTMSADACAERFLNCWWRHHGFPKTLTSDRGGNWTSKFWTELCARAGIKRRLTTSHNPRSDGQVERWNQEIQTILRGVVSYAQTDWPKFLPGVMFALNNRKSTTHGLSPFYIMHGYHPEAVELRAEDTATPTTGNADALIDRLAEAQEITQAAMGWAQERMEKQANLSRSQSEQFRVGDLVWLDLRHIKTPRTSRKLAWTHAKYKVVATPFPHVVELDVPTGIHPRFHVELLRRAPADPLPSQRQEDAQPGPAIAATEEEDEEFSIERVIRVDFMVWYGTTLPWALVKWTGYTEPTWEPLDEVEHSDAFGVFVTKWGTPVNTAIGETAGDADGRTLGPQDRSTCAAYARRVKKKKNAATTRLSEGGGIVTGHGPNVAIVGSHDTRTQGCGDGHAPNR